jgi:hypothetical protein
MMMKMARRKPYNNSNVIDCVVELARTKGWNDIHVADVEIRISRIARDL